MSYFTFPMLVAFLLGVLLSAMVKGWAAAAKSKLG